MTDRMSRRDLAAVLGGSRRRAFASHVRLARRAGRPRGRVTGAKPKSCILLWMEGGASHKDTFDLKPGHQGRRRVQADRDLGPRHRDQRAPAQARPPDAPRGGPPGDEHQPGGATARPATTCTPATARGAAAWSTPASARSPRPSWAGPTSPLPNFVSVGGKFAYGSGFLGVRHQPLVVEDPAKGVENLSPMVDASRFEGRLGLLEDMERGLLRTAGSQPGRDHLTTYRRTVALLRSKEAQAFDLSREPAPVRAAYGDSDFGRGCLLARRLVEAGVPFVEVTSPGWDTHKDNFDRVKTLSAQIDSPIAALVADLAARGRLDSTLVIWMGEFGRSPEDHHRAGHPRAGTTTRRPGPASSSAAGSRAARSSARPTPRAPRSSSGRSPALDFLATVCTLLGIDYTKENATPIGRPIRVVEKGAKPIQELLG